MSLTVSLIITSYNAAPWIERVLDSVAAQTYPADLIEIIVVDDGSSDDTRARVEARARLCANLRLIVQANQGTAGALTTGLKAARGEILCLLSHDAYAANDWIANAVSIFASDPHIGVVQGKVLPTRPIDTAFVHCTTRYRPSRSFDGVAIAYRASAVDQAGRYFDRFFSRRGDDLDMGWRILEQGYGEAWLETPTAYHEVIPKPFGQDLTAGWRMGVLPRLVQLHPGLRRRLHLRFLWGNPYRYLKIAAVHGGLLCLGLKAPWLAALFWAFTLGIMWYESLYLGRKLPVALQYKLFWIPVHQFMGDLISSYALLVGSLRWRSLVL